MMSFSDITSENSIMGVEKLENAGKSRKMSENVGKSRKNVGKSRKAGYVGGGREFSLSEPEFSDIFPRAENFRPHCWKISK